MDFDEYQLRSRSTDLFRPTEEDDHVGLLEYRTLCLCGEAGELANKVKKIRRDHNGYLTGTMRDSIAHELGDILWYMSIICDIIEMDLDEIAVRNVAMLSRRKANNKIQGSGERR